MAHPGEVDPASEFSDLERRLLAARSVRLDYHVTAEGAFEADIQGTLDIAVDGTSLTGSGHFGGQPVDLMLRTEGDEYVYGNGADRTTAVTPPALTEALIVGLTRMGILHNLARLTAGAAPDHADGGVGDWVTVDGFELEPESSALRFDLTVAGQPSGSASLEIGPEGGPVGRRQTVSFPSGEMRVVERYSGVAIGAGG